MQSSKPSRCNDRLIIKSLVLTYIAVIWILLVSLYVFICAWHDQHPSLLLFIWTLPAIILILTVIFELKGHNHHAKQH